MNIFTILLMQKFLKFKTKSHVHSPKQNRTNQTNQTSKPAPPRTTKNLI